MFNWRTRIDFFVGLEFDNDGKPVTVKPEKGVEVLLAYFPGVTVTEGYGAWEDTTSPVRGAIVKERQVTYTVIWDGNIAGCPAEMAARELKRVFNQSAVLVTISETRAAFV